ncbi:MAG: hypothetical protein U0165_00185 [Polyangiaceae bacterium]
MVDILARRCGAPWDEPELPAMSLLRELGVGFAIGGVVTSMALLVSVFAGGGHIAFGSLSIEALALGFLRAMALAYRDELILRWVPSRLAETIATPIARAVFTTILGVAPVVLGAQERPASSP